jgi:hypothetical protein
MGHAARTTPLEYPLHLVEQAIVTPNPPADWQGTEEEWIFYHVCIRLGQPGTWRQASYNGTIRARMPKPGDHYDEERDAYLTPQPHPSWSLDANHKWQAPVPYPDDGLVYDWDEPSLSWVEVVPAE